jgi:hypothetical protein
MADLFIPLARDANARQPVLATHENRYRTTRQGKYPLLIEPFLRDHGSDLRPGLSPIRGLQED